MSAFQLFNPANRGDAFNQQADVYNFEPIDDSDIQAAQDDTSELIAATARNLTQNKKARHD